jgi:hypothetical protein
MTVPDPPIVPHRPAWVDPDEIAYRSRIFGRLRGFLTYGSPLEKFAGIWPALVPINRETTFPVDVPWFSAYDPLDPVSGKQLAFQKQPPECCPKAQDIGYAASWWLLLAHLKYLANRKPVTDLAMLTTQWLLTDDASYLRDRPVGGWALGTWFPPGRVVEIGRGALAWLTWIVVAVTLALLGAIVLPVVWHAGVAAFSGVWAWIVLETAGGASS